MNRAELPVLITPLALPGSDPNRIPHRSQQAALSTSDGRFTSGVTADLEGGASGWSATLRHIERPGALASMYFGQGVRDVTLRFADGTRARGRITDARFTGGGERVYVVRGVGDFVPTPTALPQFP